MPCAKLVSELSASTLSAGPVSLTPLPTVASVKVFEEAWE
ncbi:hypothetical protein Y695_03834 [Hydrogenophaga sp. T4]|nr:hypothetical protein Y695_03834 [Hydrogenophaga sp. T4]